MFAIGTAVQAFVIIGPEMVGHAMELAGRSPEQAASDTPGLVAFLRAVGIGYLLGNALGILAFTGRTWVFWVVLVVIATEAAGVVAGMVPWVVLRSSVDSFGPLGVLPTLGTDGGAAVLTVVLIWSLARYRAPWPREAAR